VSFRAVVAEPHSTRCATTQAPPTKSWLHVLFVTGGTRALATLTPPSYDQLAMADRRTTRGGENSPLIEWPCS